MDYHKNEINLKARPLEYLFLIIFLMLFSHIHNYSRYILLIQLIFLLLIIFLLNLEEM